MGDDPRKQGKGVQEDGKVQVIRNAKGGHIVKIFPCIDQTYIKTASMGFNKRRAIKPRDYMLPYRHQLDAYDTLKDFPCKALSAGTGSGKTVAVAMLCQYMLEQNPDLKIIIAAPQLNIMANFLNIRVDMSFAGMGKVDFKPHGISGVDERTLDVISGFINSKTRAVDRVKVCTHATLAKVWERYAGLPDRQKKAAFKNLAIFIDEAHHVSGGYDDSIFMTNTGYTKAEQDEILSINRLGGMANFYLENNFNIGFVTATMYRSDAFVIQPKYAGRVKWFVLPFDAYIERYCHYINRIGYDFCIFKHDYCEVVTELFRKDPYIKTIVYLPPVDTGVSKTTGYKTGDKEELNRLKHKEVMEIIQAINPKGKVTRVIRDGAPLYEVTVKGKKLLVADMVNEKTRREVERFIREQTAKKTYAVDVIIALGCFKEGSDYPPLARAIVIDKRNSVGEMQQIFGRVLRDFKDKDFPRLYHALPAVVLARYPKDELRGVLNQYFGNILMSMLMLDMYIPKQIKLKTRPILEKVIEEEFDDSIDISQEEQQRFNSDVTTGVVERIYASEEATPEGQLRVIDEMSEHVAKERKIGAKKAKELRRRLKETFYAAALQGVNNITFDLVRNTKPLGKLTQFASSVLGVKELSEIRRIVTKAFNTEILSNDEVIARLEYQQKTFGKVTLPGDEDIPFMRGLNNVRAQIKEIAKVDPDIKSRLIENSRKRREAKYAQA